MDLKPCILTNIGSLCHHHGQDLWLHSLETQFVTSSGTSSFVNYVLCSPRYTFHHSPYVTSYLTSKLLLSVTESFLLCLPWGKSPTLAQSILFNLILNSHVLFISLLSFILNVTYCLYCMLSICIFVIMGNKVFTYLLTQCGRKLTFKINGEQGDDSVNHGCLLPPLVNFILFQHFIADGPEQTFFEIVNLLTISRVYRTLLFISCIARSSSTRTK